MENLIAGIFGLVVGVGGLVTALVGLKNRTRLNRWTTTKGKVIERGIYRPDQPMLSAPAFRYAPLVRYQYHVQGREFVSHSILPKRIQLPRHGTKKWAQKQAESFPAEVVVYHNPEDPGESYLIQTSKTTMAVLIGASCVTLIIGALFLLTWMV